MPDPDAPRDWTEGSRALLDLALVLAGLALVGLGLFLVVQDYALHAASLTATAAFGRTLPDDLSERARTVRALLWTLGVASVGVLWRAWRARRSPRLRKHARRHVALLVAGSVAGDVGLLADQYLAGALQPGWRAIAIDPLFVLAGVLVTGAAWRIRSLIRPLPRGDPEV